jgi:hypothetical protein
MHKLTARKCFYVNYCQNAKLKQIYFISMYVKNLYYISMYVQTINIYYISMYVQTINILYFNVRTNNKYIIVQFVQCTYKQ